MTVIEAPRGWVLLSFPLLTRRWCRGRSPCFLRGGCPPPAPRPFSLRSLPISGTAGECRRGGCSGEMCTDQPGMASICLWRPEYACYREAVCQRQANGRCGWTPTPGFEKCMAGVRM